MWTTMELMLMRVMGRDEIWLLVLLGREGGVASWVGSGGEARSGGAAVEAAVESVGLRWLALDSHGYTVRGWGMLMTYLCWRRIGSCGQRLMLRVSA